MMEDCTHVKFTVYIKPSRVTRFSKPELRFRMILINWKDGQDSTRWHWASGNVLFSVTRGEQSWRAFELCRTVQNSSHCLVTPLAHIWCWHALIKVSAREHHSGLKYLGKKTPKTKKPKQNLWLNWQELRSIRSNRSFNKHPCIKTE